MHNHDLDLIAALAEGTLDDETLARSRVETCEPCRAEFEAQTLAIGALAAEGPLTLSRHEQATLRRSVWTELRSGTPQRPSRSPWYQRWSFAAVGLLVIVGFAGLLSGREGPDLAAELADADLATTADQEPLEPREETAPDPMTEPATEEPDRLSRAEFLAGEATRVRDEHQGSMPFTLQSEEADEDLSQCLARSGLDDYQSVGEVVYHDDLSEPGEQTTYIIAVGTREEIGPETPVAFVDRSTCELAHLDG